MTKDNILITGGLGLVGKSLISLLARKNYNVFVLDKSNNKIRNKLIKGKQIKFVYGNFQNKPFIEKIIKKNKISVIFHTGAITQVLDSLKKPYETYKNNLMGTINILDCIKKINPKIIFIFSSSDKAYGEAKNKYYLETDSLSSIYPYDLSKSCADLICQSYSNVYGLKIGIVRCGNLYGPGDFNKNRIIPETIMSGLDNKKLKIRSSGKLVRDYLYITDAVDAYYMIMKNLKLNNSKNLLIYNVGSKDNMSVIKLVNLILSLMNKKHLKPIILNKSKKELIFQKLNYSKIKRELNWKQKVTIKKGLRYTINWYTKHYSILNK